MLRFTLYLEFRDFGVYVSSNAGCFFGDYYFFGISIFLCLFSRPVKKSGFIGANVIKELHAYNTFLTPNDSLFPVSSFHPGFVEVTPVIQILDKRHPVVPRTGEQGQ